MSSTLQEQETKQPLLTHVIFTDSEDWVPIVCFTVDTSRPTTTSLAPHHAYANRCPVLLWYARMCLPSQPWHGTGGADRTPWAVGLVPSAWGHPLTHVVGSLLGTAIPKDTEREQRSVGPDTYGHMRKDDFYPKQAKGTINIYVSLQRTDIPE